MKLDPFIISEIKNWIAPGETSGDFEAGASLWTSSSQSEAHGDVGDSELGTQKSGEKEAESCDWTIIYKLPFGLVFGLFSIFLGGSEPVEDEPIPIGEKLINTASTVLPIRVGSITGSLLLKEGITGLKSLLLQAYVSGSFAALFQRGGHDIVRGEFSGVKTYVFETVEGGVVAVVLFGSAKATANLSKGIFVKSEDVVRQILGGISYFQANRAIKADSIFQYGNKEWLNRDEIARAFTSWYLLSEEGWQILPSQFKNKQGLDMVFRNFSGDVLTVEGKVSMKVTPENAYELGLSLLKLTSKYGLQATREYSIKQAQRLIISPKATTEMKHTGLLIKDAAEKGKLKAYFVIFDKEGNFLGLHYVIE